MLWTYPQNVSEESNNVNTEDVEAWKETFLPNLLSKYTVKDIFNTDDFQTICALPKEKVAKA
jgi:hypothetical protein